MVGERGGKAEPLLSALQTQPTYIGPTSIPRSKEHWVRNAIHCTSSDQTHDSPDLPWCGEGEC